MNTIKTIRAYRMNGRIIAALVIGVLLLAALATSRASADEVVMAYASGTAQALHADRAALDTAISDSAEQANAALTRELREALESRVRSKLQLARLAMSARG